MENNVKRFICILTVALTLVFAFVGCGESKSDSFTFKYNDTEIKLNGEVAPIVEALGEPDSYDESPSCGFPGLDKHYTYGGFEFTAYPKTDDDYRVKYIKILNDTVSTPEGITIGSSVDEVKDAYGDEGKETDGNIVYENGKKSLTFGLRDGKVVSVRYDYAA